MAARRPTILSSSSLRSTAGRILGAAGLAATLLAPTGCEDDGSVLFPSSLVEHEGRHAGSLDGLGSIERDAIGSMRFETGVGCYTGDFAFQLAPGTDPSEIEELRIQLTFKGPSASQKLWIWSAYTHAEGRFRKVGDTDTAISSTWMLYDLALPGRADQYVDEDGTILIRYKCNGPQSPAADSLVDFMSLVVVEGDGAAPPAEEPPPEEPPVEEPPVEEPPAEEPPDAAVEQRIAEFRATFDATLASKIGGWRNMSLSNANDSTQYYLLALPIDGMLAMFEATRDTSYLETALELMENMISTAFVTGSGSWDPALGWRRTNGQNSLLDEIQAVQPMASVARIVLTDPELSAVYGSRARAIRDWADTNIMTKWMVRRSYGNYSTGWDWMTRTQDEPPGVLGGYIQGHQIHAMRAAQNLYEAGVTGARRGGLGWDDLADEIADIWKSRMEVQANGSILWDQDAYLWTASTTGIVDTAHANKYPAAMIDLYTAGAGFDAVDVARLARTFTRNIWNGRSDWADPDAPQPGAGSIWFRNYIDGQDDVYSEQYYRAGGSSHPHYNRPEGMSGMVYDGWCRLGMVDAEAQGACEALFDFLETTPDTVNAIRNRNGGAGLGTLALSGHLARNLRMKTW